MKKIFLLIFCLGILGLCFVKGASYPDPFTTTNTGSSTLTGGEEAIEKEISLMNIKIPSKEEIIDMLAEKAQKRTDAQEEQEKIKEVKRKRIEEANKLIDAVNSCDGYYLNGTCYISGESFNMSGDFYFVEGKTFYLKKELNESCSQNYECETGLCSNYICSLPYELNIVENETNNESENSLITGAVFGNGEPNWFGKVLIKLLNWFG